MKFKPKLAANHKYNNGLAGQDRMILYTVTTIMIFMNAVAGAGATLTTANAAASTTMAKTLLNNTSRNPIIAQQSSKTSPPQMPPPPTVISAAPDTPSSTSNSNRTTSYTYPKKTHTDNVSSGVGSSLLLPPINPISKTMDNCKSLTGTWGDVDPNIYYLCDIQTKQPLTLRCPEGRGYFNGLGYTGCIPYDNWPACVALHAREQVHICDSDHMQQPWETMNPNKFYICLQEAIEPMLLNCGQGKGFVHVPVSADATTTNGNERDGGGEVVGCANWEKWRSYMQCSDYY